VFIGSGANGTTVLVDPMSQTVSTLVAYQGTFMGYRDVYAFARELLPEVRSAVRGR
jgi:hypothetical protein